GLQATHLPASAPPSPLGDDLDVTQLASHPASSMNQLSTGDDCAPHAGANEDGQHLSVAVSGAHLEFAPGGSGQIVVEENGSLEPGCQELTQRNVAPPEVGRDGDVPIR